MYYPSYPLHSSFVSEHSDYRSYFQSQNDSGFNPFPPSLLQNQSTFSKSTHSHRSNRSQKSLQENISISYSKGNSKQMNSKFGQDWQQKSVQDENINSFNVKQESSSITYPKQELKKKKSSEVGVVKKLISKKAPIQGTNACLQESNAKKIVNQNANLEHLSKSHKASVSQSKNKGPQTKNRIQEVERVYSGDPLVGSLQQFFPEVSVDQNINTNNVDLEQFDNIIQNLPIYFNSNMYETMKQLTIRQEKLVCLKIKETQPVDSIEEIAKINPEYDLKGLSLDQLHQKLSFINKKFEDQSKLALEQQEIQPLDSLEQYNHEIAPKIKYEDLQLKKENHFLQGSIPQKQINIQSQNSECLKKEFHSNSKSDRDLLESADKSSQKSQQKMMMHLNGTIFTSPFRTNSNGIALQKRDNRGSNLISSSKLSSSSFKKTHNQFLDYIEDVMIEGNFPEDDIFRKMSVDAVSAFSHLPIQKQNILPSSGRSHNSSERSRRNANGMQSETGYDTTGQKKYYENCSRVRNFIADEEDYQHVHPFLLSSQPYNSSASRELQVGNSNTFGAISSFMRDIEDLNAFSHQSFL